MVTDGYRVRAAGMTGQAGELYGAGDDAGDIREAIGAAQCYAPAALGGPDSAAAFTAYAAAWETEARTLADALHELGTKVDLAKGAYTGTDSLVDTSVSGVTVGGGPTTMPTRAERPSALAGY